MVERTTRKNHQSLTKIKNHRLVFCSFYYYSLQLLIFWLINYKHCSTIGLSNQRIMQNSILFLVLDHLPFFLFGCIMSYLIIFYLVLYLTTSPSWPLIFWHIMIILFYDLYLNFSEFYPCIYQPSIIISMINNQKNNKNKLLTKLNTSFYI